MGDMRKDYVLEREVIVHPTAKKNTNTKKCPYCPGNESMTNLSLLSLVAKDGMLQQQETWIVFQIYLQELTKKLNLHIKSLMKRVYAQYAR